MLSVILLGNVGNTDFMKKVKQWKSVRDYQNNKIPWLMTRGRNYCSVVNHFSSTLFLFPTA
jgi:hypothetical protein